MSVRFRELTVADAPAAAAIEAVLFAGDSPWSEAAYRSEIAARHTFYLGAFDREELVGFAGLAMLGPKDDPEFEIHTIGVDPSRQGEGIGRALMDQLMHTVDLLDGPCFWRCGWTTRPRSDCTKVSGFSPRACARTTIRHPAWTRTP